MTLNPVRLKANAPGRLKNGNAIFVWKKRQDYWNEFGLSFVFPQILISKTKPSPNFLLAMPYAV